MLDRTPGLPELAKKDRMTMPRHPMPEQEPPGSWQWTMH